MTSKVPNTTFGSRLHESMVGQSLSHYEILGEIGRGGMGIVYRARDLKLNREVALKVLPSELIQDPDRRRRFIQEAQAAAGLKHPNIAIVYEIDEDDGVMFIAMELVEGEQLSELLERGSPPPQHAIDIATEVAQGLACAHDHGIVHRDLKPANIVLTADGHAKVIDFGLAKLVQGRGHTDSLTASFVGNQTAPGHIMGTASYMSPEQARGQRVDQRSDVFSFGIVLHELLTGSTPFQAPSRPELLTAIMNVPHARLPPSHAKLQPIVDTCLAKAPEDRYRDAHRLVDALASPTSKARSGGGWRWLALAALLAAAIGLVWTWIGRARTTELNWALETGLRDLQRLVDEDEYGAAFELAKRLDVVIPDNPLLLEFWPKLSQVISVTTSPADADVWYRSQSTPDAEWTHLGPSPVVREPVPCGAFWLTLEKPGFHTIESLFWGPGYNAAPDRPNLATVELDEAGSIPPNMVRVPASTTSVYLAGFDYEKYAVPSYLIDKYEVTNREFQAFVDGGAYHNQDSWRHEFRDATRHLQWHEAMDLFRDRTGRRGPSTWEVGRYAEGAAEHPASGVSWFEAAAYCESVGKHLPAIIHWTAATATHSAEVIIPISNIGDQGLLPVGSHPPGIYGTYDMAGNAKEWCWNRVGGRRYILGGAWNEPAYMFWEADAQSPFERLPGNGFRCADLLDADDKELAPLLAPIDLPAPPVDLETASDEVYKSYRALFEFDPVPLEAHIGAVEETASWTRERITFRAAYAADEVVAYLFLPVAHHPPYQAIVYFPGGSAFRQSSPEQLQLRIIDFLIKSGRAVMYPIYRGTYERRSDDLPYPWKSAAILRSRAFVDYSTSWISDLTRSVDYLVTRDDIRADGLAYLGFSWGGETGPLALALEPRFAAGVLLDGGIDPIQPRPEVQPQHYAARVEIPVLMVNGMYDAYFSLESSQRPHFERLGTAPEHKKHVLYPCSHVVFTRYRNQAIGDILDWFDTYLGPTS